MFKPDGKPCRATVRTGTWILDVTYENHQAPPPARHLVAHEAAHVVQGVRIHGWEKVQEVRSGAHNDMRFFRSRTGHQFLPEVDDQVLVAFESGDPRATAVMFNPKEIKLSKPVPWGQQSQGDVGMVRTGNYQIVVRQRGTEPLPIIFVVAKDPALRHDVHTIRLF